MSNEYEESALLVTYAKWHYGRGLREFFGVVGNLLWFIGNFFSFKLFSETLFAPWKRFGEAYEGSLGFKKYAFKAITETPLRIAGLFVRVSVLIIGATSYFFVLGLSFFAFLIWILAPLVIIGSLVLSATFFVV